MYGRVLIIAGSDSGGGAGIQADIKTVTALGAYAATAVTALTAQNTLGVKDVFEVAPDFVALQMRVVLEDIGADCVKTGMLHNASIVKAVENTLEEYAKSVPLVVDPVIVAKGGSVLVDDEGAEEICRSLVPRAYVLTPNLPEAEQLTGLRIKDLDDMNKAAKALLGFGPQAVLLTGGHLNGERIYDVLASKTGLEVFESSRIVSLNTHGTGCTLASAIATGLAQNMPLRDAIVRARAYVHAAIRLAPGLGHGHGPLNHAQHTYKCTLS